MKYAFILVFVMGVFLQGCATAKGAASGFKEDWKTIEKADEWMQENMW